MPNPLPSPASSAQARSAPDGRPATSGATSRVASAPPACAARATVHALTRFESHPPMKSAKPYDAAASSDSSTVT